VTTPFITELLGRNDIGMIGFTLHAAAQAR
jgi:hypothetical protein